MFQNKTYEETLIKEGYTIIPFLNNEELIALQKFYSDAHPNDEIPDMRYGIHMTSWCKDGVYKLPMVLKAFYNQLQKEHLKISVPIILSLLSKTKVLTLHFQYIRIGAL